VTTILDSQLGWSKRALIQWARREALEGNDSNLILLDTGSIGTVAHLLIQGFIEGRDPNIADFTSNQIEAGSRALENFKSWLKGKEVEFLHLEKRVVSEKFRYGGTLDILAVIKGLLCLLDLKTSKAIYPEFICQIAAYGLAYEEQESGHIAEYHLLQLGKDGSGYQHHVLTEAQIETGFEVFLHCRQLYDLQKRLKGAIF
jgi:hypothetical protein